MTSIQKYREPVQLAFEFYIQEENDAKKYSHSIELYDAIPKYHWGKVQRDSGGHLPTLVRTFKHKGLEYEAEITPARIRKRGEGEREYYPSAREEFVEDALRKIATAGRARQINKRYGLEFTLYELMKELERTGHSYSLNQIKDALNICSKTNITLTCKSGGDSLKVNQPMFPLLVLAKRKDWIEGKQRAVVDFNDLVTKSIEQQTFRQINYERSMKLTSALARWLHKRMSHNYTQASCFANTYSITLTTIIRDSGMTPYKRLSDSRKYIKKSIQELLRPDVIYKYDENATKEGNKLVDVKFSLSPTVTFTSEMKRANAKRKSLGDI